VSDVLSRAWYAGTRVKCGMALVVVLVVVVVAPAVAMVTPAQGVALPARSASSPLATPAAHSTKTTKKKKTKKKKIKPPTATATAATGPTCGGEVPPPKPGGPWKCTLDDEFDAATGDPNALNTKLWVPQVTATSGYATGSPLLNDACYENSPANISVSNGYLHLTAVRVTSPFLCGLALTQYTSGMVSTNGTFSQTYGRFEVRAEIPQSAARGLQETLWLYPSDSSRFGPFPETGEIDFAEFYSDSQSEDIPFLHYDYAASTTDASTETNVVTNQCPIDPTQFNDYAVVWEPGTFTISVNGTTCLTDNDVPDKGLTSPEPFNQPFFLVLTQAFGHAADSFDAAETVLPATTLIKYVRVWQ
jgi:beta-glucanase (GH16 family)